MWSPPTWYLRNNPSTAWSLDFYLNKRDDFVRCPSCRFPLVLVSMHGSASKGAGGSILVLCGNHCDRICPRCLGECEFVNEESCSPGAGRIECDDCEWEGSIPDRRFLAAVERHDLEVDRQNQIKEAEARSSAILLRRLALDAKREREVKAAEQRGVLCPKCRRREVQWMTELVTANTTGRQWMARVTRCSFCGRVGEPQWIEYSLTQMASGSAREWSIRAPEVDGWCRSCDQVVRTGGRCGCS